jgi:hypothetical protein
MRGDDALSRAAADVAAPRRRLLAGLRDAHAEACQRLSTLRRCDAALAAQPPGRLPVRAVLARLMAEAEEQLRRLELVFAQLRERPGAGLVGTPPNDLVAMAARDAPGRDAALLLALEGEERRGREEVLALRRLATLAGQHLAARLLDLTTMEREAAARDIAACLLPADGGERPPLSH